MINHKLTKSKIVNKVFDDVYNKYDLMNDIMSFGTHRLWKKTLVSWINPRSRNKVIDVAAGTGDIAKICSKYTNNKCNITCVEPNQKMLGIGKKNFLITIILNGFYHQQKNCHLKMTHLIFMLLVLELEMSQILISH